MAQRIQTPPGEEREGREHPLAGRQQLERGVGPVPDHHQGPVGPPVGPDTQHRAGPVNRLVAPALGRIVATGGRQHGRKGQSPDPGRPGHIHPQHQADPAQPLGLDEVAAGGPHGILVHPQSGNLGPPAPFPGLIDPQPDGVPRRHQVRDQQTPQHLAYRQGGPDGPVEDVVIQGGGYGALVRRQNHPHPQVLDLAPGPRIKKRCQGGAATL